MKQSKSSYYIKNPDSYHPYNAIGDLFYYLNDTKITKYIAENVRYTSLQIKDTTRFHLKLAASIIFICIYVTLNMVFPREDFTYELECFDDKVFTMTAGVNNYFRENDLLLRAYLIIAGFLMDCAIVLGFYYFAVHFRTWRMAFNLAILYGVRGQIQELYVMGHPKGILFKDPGIISISVPYYDTHDYFFSGHVSLPTLIAVEFYKHKYNKLAFFCFFVSFFELIMMVFLRGHYSIDLYAGLIFSFYVCKISDYIIPYIDNFINADIYDHEKKPNSNINLDNKTIRSKSLTSKVKNKAKFDLGKSNIMDDCNLLTKTYSLNHLSDKDFQQAFENIYNNKNSSYKKINKKKLFENTNLDSNLFSKLNKSDSFINKLEYKKSNKLK